MPKKYLIIPKSFGWNWFLRKDLSDEMPLECIIQDFEPKNDILEWSDDLELLRMTHS